MPHLCYTQWGEGGNVRNQQAKAARNLARPKLSTLWAAGVAFSKCHAEREVPYDPYTPHVFDGEEFSRGARLWTAGCARSERERRRSRLVSIPSSRRIVPRA